MKLINLAYMENSAQPYVGPYNMNLSDNIYGNHIINVNYCVISLLETT